MNMQILIKNLTFDFLVDFTMQEKVNSEKESYPIIAGVLLLVSAILSILSGIVIYFFGATNINLILSQQTVPSEISIEFIQSLLMLCGAVVVILSIFVVLGGIMSLKKQKWGFALGGAILGLFTFGPLFISSIMCFIAVILLIISKKDFKR